MVWLRASFITVVTMLLMAFAAPSASGVLIAGDVDGSGEVDATDIQLTINAALGITVPFNTNIDFDSQGATTAIDIQLVINAALGLVIDSDGDGLADAAETNLGTNPNVKDTDGGGVDDGTEVIIDHTNPLNSADDQGVVLPTADFTATPVTGSFPLDVQFTDTSTNGTSTINQWHWVFGDTTSSTLQNPLHTYTQAGSYNVSLTVTSQAGHNSVTKNGYITVTQPAQQQVHWTALQDGFWDDGANWSTGQVPNAQQLAVVDLPSQNITVTIRQGTTIYNADIKENLTIIGSGALDEAGQATVSGTLTITGGGTLMVSGAGASFTANGPVSLQNPQIVVNSGGVASFPTLTSFTFTTNTNPTLFNVSGAGSSLDLSHLTAFTFDDSASSSITAYITVANSGHIDLSGLSTVTLGTNHHYEFDVSSGGTIAANLLQSNSGLRVFTSTGGSLSLPGLTSLSNVSVTGTGSVSVPNAVDGDLFSLSMTGGTFTAASLTTLTSPSIDLETTASASFPVLTSITSTSAKNVYFSDSAGFSAPNLASITNMILLVRTGGNLTLPISSYHWTLNANPTVFDVSGSGSQLHLPNLTGMTFDAGISSSIRMYISSGTNGAISMPLLATVTLGTNHTYELDATGGGTISANSLTSNAGLRLSPSAGSTLTLPGLTSLSGVAISGTGNLSFPNATSGAGLSVALTAGTLTAAGLTGLTDSSVDLEGTASVSFPNLTSITSSTAKNFYFADAAAFSAPNLASITNMVLLVRTGGNLTLPITSYHWTLNANPTVFDVSGVGSQLHLPNMTGITFDAGIASSIRMYISSGSNGAISMPALANVVLGTNHTYELDIASGGTISANSLATNAGLRLSTSGSSTLTLPGLTSLSGVSFSGTGNVSVPNATTGAGVTVSLTAGTLTAASLTSLTDSSLDVEGTTSVSFPNLTSVTSSTAKNFYFSDAAVFSAPNLASLTNMVLLVRTSGNLSLPITSYHWTVNGNPTVFDVSGTGSQLHLPNMTAITFDAGIASSIRMYISSASNGAISMPVLATVNLGTNHTYELDIASGGTTSANNLATNSGLRLSTSGSSTLTLPGLTSVTGLAIAGTGNVSLPNATSGTGLSVAITGGTFAAASLTSLTDASLDVETGASVSFASLTSITSSTSKVFYFADATSSFSAPSLASITNLILQVRGGAHLSLPITSYNWTLNANPTGLDASGASTQLNLPSLTHLTFDIGASASITFSAQASSGGHINVAALSSVTLGTNHHMTVNADGASSQIAITALNPVPAGVTITGTNGGTIS